MIGANRAAYFSICACILFTLFSLPLVSRAQPSAEQNGCQPVKDAKGNTKGYINTGCKGKCDQKVDKCEVEKNEDPAVQKALQDATSDSAGNYQLQPGKTSPQLPSDGKQPQIQWPSQTDVSTSNFLDRYFNPQPTDAASSPEGKSMFQQLYEYGFGGSSESSVDLGAGNPAEWTPAFTPGDVGGLQSPVDGTTLGTPNSDVFPQGLPQAGNTFGGSTFDPVTAPPPSQTFFDQAKTYLAAGYESFTEMARDAWDRLAGPNNVPYQGDDGIFYKDSSKTELATKSQMDNLKWRPVDRSEGFKDPQKLTEADATKSELKAQQFERQQAYDTATEARNTLDEHYAKNAKGQYTCSTADQCKQLAADYKAYQDTAKLAQTADQNYMDYYNSLPPALASDLAGAPGEGLMGPPAPLDPAAVDPQLRPFVEALNNGDTARAAEVLRNMGQLSEANQQFIDRTLASNGINIDPKTGELVAPIYADPKWAGDLASAQQFQGELGQISRTATDQLQGAAFEAAQAAALPDSVGAAGDMFEAEAARQRSYAEELRQQQNELVAGATPNTSGECSNVCGQVLEPGRTTPTPLREYLSRTQDIVNAAKADAAKYQSVADFFKSGNPLATPEVAQAVLQGDFRSGLIAANIAEYQSAQTQLQGFTSADPLSSSPESLYSPPSAFSEKLNQSEANIQRLASGGEFTSYEARIERLQSDPLSVTDAERARENVLSRYQRDGINSASDYLNPRAWANSFAASWVNAYDQVFDPTFAMQTQRMLMTSNEILNTQIGSVASAAFETALFTPPVGRLMAAGLEAAGRGFAGVFPETAAALGAAGREAMAALGEVAALPFDAFERSALRSWWEAGGITGEGFRMGAGEGLSPAAGEQASLRSLEGLNQRLAQVEGSIASAEARGLVATELDQLLVERGLLDARIAEMTAAQGGKLAPIASDRALVPYDAAAAEARAAELAGAQSATPAPLSAAEQRAIQNFNEAIAAENAASVRRALSEGLYSKTTAAREALADVGLYPGARGLTRLGNDAPVAINMENGSYLMTALPEGAPPLASGGVAAESAPLGPSGGSSPPSSGAGGRTASAPPSSPSLADRISGGIDRVLGRAPSAGGSSGAPLPSSPAAQLQLLEREPFVPAWSSIAPEATDMLRTAGDSVGELVSTAGSVVRGVANSAASRLTGTARTIEQLTGLPLLRGLGLLAGGLGLGAPDANGGDLTAPTSDVGLTGTEPEQLGFAPTNPILASAPGMPPAAAAPPSLGTSPVSTPSPTPGATAPSAPPVSVGTPPAPATSPTPTPAPVSGGTSPSAASPAPSAGQAAPTAASSPFSFLSGLLSSLANLARPKPSTAAQKPQPRQTRAEFDKEIADLAAEVAKVRQGMVAPFGTAPVISDARKELETAIEDLGKQVDAAKLSFAAPVDSPVRAPEREELGKAMEELQAEVDVVRASFAVAFGVVPARSPQRVELDKAIAEMQKQVDAVNTELKKPFGTPPETISRTVLDNAIKELAVEVAATKSALATGFDTPPARSPGRIAFGKAVQELKKEVVAVRATLREPFGVVTQVVPTTPTPSIELPPPAPQSAPSPSLFSNPAKFVSNWWRKTLDPKLGERTLSVTINGQQTPIVLKVEVVEKIGQGQEGLGGVYRAEVREGPANVPRQLALKFYSGPVPAEVVKSVSMRQTLQEYGFPTLSFYTIDEGSNVVVSEYLNTPNLVALSKDNFSALVAKKSLDIPRDAFNNIAGQLIATEKLAMDRGIWIPADSYFLMVNPKTGVPESLIIGDVGFVQYADDPLIRPAYAELFLRSFIDQWLRSDIDPTPYFQDIAARLKSSEGTDITGKDIAQLGSTGSLEPTAANTSPSLGSRIAAQFPNTAAALSSLRNLSRVNSIEGVMTQLGVAIVKDVAKNAVDAGRAVANRINGQGSNTADGVVPTAPQIATAQRAAIQQWLGKKAGERVTSDEFALWNGRDANASNLNTPAQAFRNVVDALPQLVMQVATGDATAQRKIVELIDLQAPVLGFQSSAFYALARAQDISKLSDNQRKLIELGKENGATIVFFSQPTNQEVTIDVNALAASGIAMTPTKTRLFLELGSLINDWNASAIILDDFSEARDSAARNAFRIQVEALYPRPLVQDVNAAGNSYTRAVFAREGAETPETLGELNRIRQTYSTQLNPILVPLIAELQGDTGVAAEAIKRSLRYSLTTSRITYNALPNIITGSRVEQSKVGFASYLDGVMTSLASVVENPASGSIAAFFPESGFSPREQARQLFGRQASFLPTDTNSARQMVNLAREAGTIASQQGSDTALLLAHIVGVQAAQAELDFEYGRVDGDYAIAAARAVEALNVASPGIVEAAGVRLAYSPERTSKMINDILTDGARTAPEKGVALNISLEVEMQKDLASRSGLNFAANNATGDIALLRGVQGTDGAVLPYGLLYIQKQSPDVLPVLGEILQKGTATRVTQNVNRDTFPQYEIVLPDVGRALIATEWNGQPLNWVVSAQRFATQEKGPAQAQGLGSESTGLSTALGRPGTAPGGSIIAENSNLSIARSAADYKSEFDRVLREASVRYPDEKLPTAAQVVALAQRIAGGRGRPSIFYERVGGKTEENVSKFLSSMIREDSVRVVVNQLGYSVDELDQISTAVENTQQNYRKQLASVLGADIWLPRIDRADRAARRAETEVARTQAAITLSEKFGSTFTESEYQSVVTRYADPEARLNQVEATKEKLKETFGGAFTDYEYHRTAFVYADPVSRLDAIQKELSSVAGLMANPAVNLGSAAAYKSARSFIMPSWSSSLETISTRSAMLRDTVTKVPFSVFDERFLIATQSERPGSLKDIVGTIGAELGIPPEIQNIYFAQEIGRIPTGLPSELALISQRRGTISLDDVQTFGQASNGRSWSELIGAEDVGFDIADWRVTLSRLFPNTLKNSDVLDEAVETVRSSPLYSEKFSESLPGIVQNIKRTYSARGLKAAEAEKMVWEQLEHILNLESARIERDVLVALRQPQPSVNTLAARSVNSIRSMTSLKALAILAPLAGIPDASLIGNLLAQLNPITPAQSQPALQPVAGEIVNGTVAPSVANITPQTRAYTAEQIPTIVDVQLENGHSFKLDRTVPVTPRGNRTISSPGLPDLPIPNFATPLHLVLEGKNLITAAELERLIDTSKTKIGEAATAENVPASGPSAHNLDSTVEWRVTSIPRGTTLADIIDFYRNQEPIDASEPAQVPLYLSPMQMTGRYIIANGGEVRAIDSNADARYDSFEFGRTNLAFVGVVDINPNRPTRFFLLDAGAMPIQAGGGVQLPQGTHTLGSTFGLYDMVSIEDMRRVFATNVPEIIGFRMFTPDGYMNIISFPEPKSLDEVFNGEINLPFAIPTDATVVYEYMNGSRELTKAKPSSITSPSAPGSLPESEPGVLPMQPLAPGPLYRDANAAPSPLFTSGPLTATFPLRVINWLQKQSFSDILSNFSFINQSQAQPAQPQTPAPTAIREGVIRPQVPAQSAPVLTQQPTPAPRPTVSERLRMWSESVKRLGSGNVDNLGLSKGLSLLASDALRVAAWGLENIASPFAREKAAAGPQFVERLPETEMVPVEELVAELEVNVQSTPQIEATRRGFLTGAGSLLALLMTTGTDAEAQQAQKALQRTANAQAPQRNISFTIETARHGSAADITTSNFATLLDGAEVYVPEMSGWTPDALADYRAVSKGTMTPEQYFRTRGHEITADLRNSFEFAQLSQIYGKGKYIAIVDIPESRLDQQLGETVGALQQIELGANNAEMYGLYRQKVLRFSDLIAARETYMIGSLASLTDSIRQGRIPELRTAQAVDVFMRIGSAHSPFYWDLKRRGEVAERIYPTSPYIFDYFAQLERTYSFTKKVDERLVTLGLFEQVFQAVFAPIFSDNYAQNTVFIRQTLASFSPGEIDAIFNATRAAREQDKGRVFEGMVRSLAQQKKIVIPRNAQEFERLVADSGPAKVTVQNEPVLAQEPTIVRTGTQSSVAEPPMSERLRMWADQIKQGGARTDAFGLLGRGVPLIASDLLRGAAWAIDKVSPSTEAETPEAEETGTQFTRREFISTVFTSGASIAASTALDSLWSTSAAQSVQQTPALGSQTREGVLSLSGWDKWIQNGQIVPLYTGEIATLKSLPTTPVFGDAAEARAQQIATQVRAMQPNPEPAYVASFLAYAGLQNTPAFAQVHKASYAKYEGKTTYPSGDDPYIWGANISKEAAWANVEIGRAVERLELSGVPIISFSKDTGTRTATGVMEDYLFAHYAAVAVRLDGNENNPAEGARLAQIMFARKDLTGMLNVVSRGYTNPNESALQHSNVSNKDISLSKYVTDFRPDYKVLLYGVGKELDAWIARNYANQPGVTWGLNSGVRPLSRTSVRRGVLAGNPFNSSHGRGEAADIILAGPPAYQVVEAGRKAWSDALWKTALNGLADKYGLRHLGPSISDWPHIDVDPDGGLGSGAATQLNKWRQAIAQEAANRPTVQQTTPALVTQPQPVTRLPAQPEITPPAPAPAQRPEKLPEILRKMQEQIRTKGVQLNAFGLDQVARGVASMLLGGTAWVVEKAQGTQAAETRIDLTRRSVILGGASVLASTVLDSSVLSPAEAAQVPLMGKVEFIVRGTPQASEYLASLNPSDYLDVRWGEHFESLRDQGIAVSRSVESSIDPESAMFAISVVSRERKYSTCAAVCNIVIGKGEAPDGSVISFLTHSLPTNMMTSFDGIQQIETRYLLDQGIKSLVDQSKPGTVSLTMWIGGSWYKRQGNPDSEAAYQEPIRLLEEMVRSIDPTIPLYIPGGRTIPNLPNGGHSLDVFQNTPADTTTVIASREMINLMRKNIATIPRTQADLRGVQQTFANPNIAPQPTRPAPLNLRGQGGLNMGIAGVWNELARFVSEWVRFGLGLSQPASLTDEQIGVTMLINNIRSRPLGEGNPEALEARKVELQNLVRTLNAKGPEILQAFQEATKEVLGQDRTFSELSFNVVGGNTESTKPFVDSTDIDFIIGASPALIPPTTRIEGNVTRQQRIQIVNNFYKQLATMMPEIADGNNTAGAPAYKIEIKGIGQETPEALDEQQRAQGNIVRIASVRSARGAPTLGAGLGGAEDWLRRVGNNLAERSGTLGAVGKVMQVISGADQNIPAASPAIVPRSELGQMLQGMQEEQPAPGIEVGQEGLPNQILTAGELPLPAFLESAGGQVRPLAGSLRDVLDRASAVRATSNIAAGPITAANGAVRGLAQLVRNNGSGNGSAVPPALNEAKDALSKLVRRPSAAVPAQAPPTLPEAAQPPSSQISPAANGIDQILNGVSIALPMSVPKLAAQSVSQIVRARNQGAPTVPAGSPAAPAIDENTEAFVSALDERRVAEAKVTEEYTATGKDWNALNAEEQLQEYQKSDAYDAAQKKLQDVNAVESQPQSSGQKWSLSDLLRGATEVKLPPVTTGGRSDDGSIDASHTFDTGQGGNAPEAVPEIGIAQVPTPQKLTSPWKVASNLIIDAYDTVRSFFPRSATDITAENTANAARQNFLKNLVSEDSLGIPSNAELFDPYIKDAQARLDDVTSALTNTNGLDANIVDNLKVVKAGREDVVAGLQNAQALVDRAEKTADSAERANLANSAQEQAEAAFNTINQMDELEQATWDRIALAQTNAQIREAQSAAIPLAEQPEFYENLLQKVDANVREAVRRIQAAQPTSQAAAQPAVPGAQPQSPQAQPAAQAPTANGTPAKQVPVSSIIPGSQTVAPTRNSIAPQNVAINADGESILAASTRAGHGIAHNGTYNQDAIQAFTISDATGNRLSATVLGDGAGGVGVDPARASEIVVRHVSDALHALPANASDVAVQNAIKDGVVNARAEFDAKNVGEVSTLALGVILEKPGQPIQAVVANLGDSPVMLRKADGSISRLTADHGELYKVVRSGAITIAKYNATQDVIDRATSKQQLRQLATEAGLGPDSVEFFFSVRNSLSGYVGRSRSSDENEAEGFITEPEIHILTLNAGESLLVMSDGVSDVLTTGQMEAAMKTTASREAAANLLGGLARYGSGEFIGLTASLNMNVGDIKNSIGPAAEALAANLKMTRASDRSKPDDVTVAVMAPSPGGIARAAQPTPRTAGQRIASAWDTSKLIGRLVRNTALPAMRPKISRNLGLNIVTGAAAFGLTGPLGIVTWPALNATYRYARDLQYRADIARVASYIRGSLQSGKTPLIPATNPTPIPTPTPTQPAAQAGGNAALLQHLEGALDELVMAQDEMTVAARSANARDFTAAQAALARATPHLDQGLTSWREADKLLAEAGDLSRIAGGGSGGTGSGGSGAGSGGGGSGSGSGGSGASDGGNKKRWWLVPFALLSTYVGLNLWATDDQPEQPKPVTKAPGQPTPVKITPIAPPKKQFDNIEQALDQSDNPDKPSAIGCKDSTATCELRLKDGSKVPVDSDKGKKELEKIGCSGKCYDDAVKRMTEPQPEKPPAKPDPETTKTAPPREKTTPDLGPRTKTGPTSGKGGDTGAGAGGGGLPNLPWAQLLSALLGRMMGGSAPCQNVTNPFPINIFQPTGYSPQYPCPAPTEPTTPTTPMTPQPQPIVTLVAASSTVDTGQATKLMWSSVHTLRCAVFGPGSSRLVVGGSNGSVMTPKLTRSTEFGVVCEGTTSNTWATAKTVVRVRGSTESVVPVVFSTGGTSGSSGSPTLGQPSPTPTPQPSPSPTSPTPMTPPSTTPPSTTTSWCDPNLPINVFIQCLCNLDANACQPYRSNPVPPRI